MARSRLPTVIATLVAMVIAGYLVLQQRDERQALAQLRERAAALELALRNRPVPVVAPPLAMQPAPAVPEAPPPAAAPPAIPEAAAPPVPQPAVVLIRGDGKPDPDPNAGGKMVLAMLYGDLQKELGLSAEQVEALAQLTVRGNGTPAAVEAILGAKYRQFQEQGWSSSVNNQLTSLRSSLASSEHPLTDAQAERLKQAMMVEARRRDGEVAARERPADPRALLDYEEQNVKFLEASNERLLAGARSHLVAEQTAVLQSSLSMGVNTRRRALQSRRARLDAGGSGAPEPLIMRMPATTFQAPSPPPR
jgi:hypothetical protein